MTTSKRSYNKGKRSRHITVSDQAWEKLEQSAIALGISRSELIEKIGNGKILLLVDISGTKNIFSKTP